MGAIHPPLSPILLSNLLRISRDRLGKIPLLSSIAVHFKHPVAGELITTLRSLSPGLTGGSVSVTGLSLVTDRVTSRRVTDQVTILRVIDQVTIPQVIGRVTIPQVIGRVTILRVIGLVIIRGGVPPMMIMGPGIHQAPCYSHLWIMEVERQVVWGTL